MTHPADVADIARQAAILVGKAEALGVTLRITAAPRQPLAMGNHIHVIDAWPARHGKPTAAVGRSSGAAESSFMERCAPGFTRETNGLPSQTPRPISDREWAAQPANLREGCTAHVNGVGDI